MTAVCYNTTRRAKLAFSMRMIMGWGILISGSMLAINDVVRMI